MDDSDAVAIDLRGLQARLDGLHPGAKVGLALATYRRLFGENDEARHRAEHFARGHRCALALQGSVVVFHKLEVGAA